MVSINPKLKYLQLKLAEFEENQRRIQEQIEVTLPADFSTKDALEKRLYLIFGNIEKVQQEIQAEENNWNDKLAQRKFDDLIKIIQSTQIIWEQIQQAYCNTLLHWPVRFQQNVDDVRSIVTELNKIAQGSCSYSALDEFIANLFNKISDVTVNDALTQWGQEYRQDVGWRSLHQKIQESEAERLKNVQSAIVITITRSDEESTQTQDSDTYYQLESWLIEDIETYQSNKTGFHSLLKADSPDASPCLLEQLLERITLLLDRFLQKQREHYRNCNNDPEIHVFLPLELMHLGVDNWLITSRDRLKQLGHDHLVLIHCADRYNRKYDQGPSWRRFWNRHQNLLQEPAPNVFVSGHDDDLDQLMEILDDAGQDDRTVIGLQVTNAPIDTKNLVSELLDSGLPIAIWSRRNLVESAHQTQVSNLLTSCCLKTLPSEVKTKRRETRRTENTKDCHIGHHLSLLWDDPNFYPPRSA